MKRGSVWAQGYFLAGGTIRISPIALVLFCGLTQAQNTITTLDTTGPGGRAAAIMVPSDGLPVIAYGAKGDLRLVKCGNPACTVNNLPITIDPVHTADTTGYVDGIISVVPGSDRLPIISYISVYTAPVRGYLKVAKCGNANCSAGNTISFVDTTGFPFLHNSMVVGVDGFPVIAYYSARGNQKLKVAKCSDASCSSGSTFILMDSIGSETSMSISLGWDGLPIISYLDGNNYDLKVAKCGNTNCISGNVLTSVDTVNSMGYGNSIVIGSDGFPIISYAGYGSSYQQLKFTKCGNNSCSGGNTFQILDSTFSSVGFTSIVIGSDGFPIIVYYKGDSLTTAKCGNLDCTAGNIIASVDTTRNTGLRPSIAIGNDGLPIISFYGLSDNELKVAKCSNPACTDNPGAILPFRARRMAAKTPRLFPTGVLMPDGNRFFDLRGRRVISLRVGL